MCMKNKPKVKVASIIDATQAPYTIFGIGIKKKNPRRCIGCGEPMIRSTGASLWFTTRPVVLDVKCVSFLKRPRHTAKARAARPTYDLKASAGEKPAQPSA